MLFRVILGMFHLHTVVSGWVGGCKCWNMLLMTGRSDKSGYPQVFIFEKWWGFFVLVEEIFESKLVCFTLCQISDQIFASFNAGKF